MMGEDHVIFKKDFINEQRRPIIPQEVLIEQPDGFFNGIIAKKKMHGMIRWPLAKTEKLRKEIAKVKMKEKEFE